MEVTLHLGNYNIASEKALKMAAGFGVGGHEELFFCLRSPLFSTNLSFNSYKPLKLVSTASILGQLPASSSREKCAGVVNGFHICFHICLYFSTKALICVSSASSVKLLRDLQVKCVVVL